MAADTLIFKRKNGINEVKITSLMRNGNGHENARIRVNMNDFHDVALFLEDLRSMWNVPIDKAVDEYRRNRTNNNWPF